MLKESLLKLFKLDGLLSNVTGYVEARIELMKLDIKEDLARGLAKMAVFVVLGFALMLFVLLISMAIAFKIGESLGNFSGFGIVAVGYFLIGCILYLLRDSITASLEKQLTELLNKKKK